MSTLTLTQNDSNGSFDVKVGDTVVVNLPESPTTGYRWEIEQAGGPELALQDSDFALAGSGVGGGGAHSFSFVAKQTGTASVSFKHWRTWEGESSVTKRFSVKINVQ